jgi:hypothetical protein
MEGSFQLIKAHAARAIATQARCARFGGRGFIPKPSITTKMPRDAEAKVIEESKKARQQQASE